MVTVILEGKLEEMTAQAAAEKVNHSQTRICMQLRFVSQVTDLLVLSAIDVTLLLLGLIPHWKISASLGCPCFNWSSIVSVDPRAGH